MSFDPKVYRNSKDGIGGPADDKATDATSAWTSVSLLKGLYHLLSVTGITVSGGTLATAAKQDTGNATLTAIDGHVDGLETAVAATNTLLTTQAGYLDGLETLVTSTNTKLDSSITQETAVNTILGAAADAASATTTVKAALRGIATALGITALDLGSGTGGSRTLRWFHDTAQWIGGAGAVTSAVQRTTLASDDPAVAVLGVTTGAAVTTSVTGTIQGYLRGIVSLLVSGITVATHAVTQSGTWTVSIKDISNGEYETVAASQTAQAIGATGATGDFISGLLIIPATTSPGNVLLLDNATSITVFAGGASSLSNLVPFFVPLGMISVSGAWKVTTGASVSVIAVGNFT